MCDACPDGALKDSIVNFGEPLPERDFQLASRMSLEADLTMVYEGSLFCYVPLILSEGDWQLDESVSSLQYAQTDDNEALL